MLVAPLYHYGVTWSCFRIKDLSLKLQVNTMKAAQCAIIPSGSGLVPLDYNVIGHYMKEIGQYRLLTMEETQKLVLLVYEDDDRQAGRMLVVGNLRLVVKLVMTFQCYWKDNFLDLVQEGNFGLAKAVGKFDPYKGVKFSSYAVYWIKAYILKFIMDNWRMVKIGTTQAQRKLFYKLNREKKLLESQGVEPGDTIVAQRLGVREQDVVEMGQRLDNNDLSLEAPVGDDSNLEQKVFLKSSEPGVEEKVAEREYVIWFRAQLEQLRKKLNDREQVILFERLLGEEPRTLNDIAEQFSISRERIRQIEVGLFGKLKKLFVTDDN